MARLAELGREGLLLLCGDSTNADRDRDLDQRVDRRPPLERLFAHCPGRIVVTCFASKIDRVQQAVDAAAADDRKVALVGRSMRKNVNIGRSLGHIDVPEGPCPAARAGPVPGRELVIISTGPGASRCRASAAWFVAVTPAVEPTHGDTVVFSATR